MSPKRALGSRMSPSDHNAINTEIRRLQAAFDEAQQAQADTTLPPERKDHTNLLVAATVVLAVITITAIVGIFALRPDASNGPLIATILGFMVPIMTALIGGAVQQLHAAVNSRLTQLLATTAARSRAEGMLAQRQLTDAAIQGPPAPRSPRQ